MEDEDRLGEDQGDGILRRVGGPCHIVVDGIEVDKVQTAKYLGPCLTKKDHVMTKLKTKLGNNKSGGRIEQRSYCMQRIEQSY